MDVVLKEITLEDRKKLENLFPYYIYDVSEYMGWGPTAEGHYNTYSSAKLDIYWQADDHIPLFIYADKELAGFVLIRKYPADTSVYDIAQYFILRKFKRQGVGKKALQRVLGQYPGKWQIRVLLENTGALKFWLSAVSEVTENKYQLSEDIDVDLTMNFIRFRIPSRE